MIGVSQLVFVQRVVTVLQIAHGGLRLSCAVDSFVLTDCDSRGLLICDEVNYYVCLCQTIYLSSPYYC